MNAPRGLPDNDANDDKTVIVSGAPGASASFVTHNVLPAGTRLGEFEIVGLIGEGGFGIVYLAFDTSLDRHVALKEYMPSALAARIGATQVQVKSARYETLFRAGLKSFINDEARLLARFDHQSLVKVYRFWEANGTAYMVMPYYRGVTLRDALKAMPRPPDEAWLRALLTPLIDALAVLHAANCFHRDIAPDNIILLEDGHRPVLLDFGAARRVIGDMTQALTVILKPGYAPIEQYAEVPSLRQGPWTDHYALAALVYFAITGKTPPPSVGRMVKRQLSAARKARGRALLGALSEGDRSRPRGAARASAADGSGVRRRTRHLARRCCRRPDGARQHGRRSSALAAAHRLDSSRGVRACRGGRARLLRAEAAAARARFRRCRSCGERCERAGSDREPSRRRRKRTQRTHHTATARAAALLARRRIRAHRVPRGPVLRREGRRAARARRRRS